jgi:hypothetical protein
LNKNHSAAWEQVQLAAKVADLKDDHYRLLLAASAVLELLAEKGIITPEELYRKAAQLDREPAALTDALLHPRE